MVPPLAIKREQRTHCFGKRSIPGPQRYARGRNARAQLKIISRNRAARELLDTCYFVDKKHLDDVVELCE